MDTKLDVPYFSQYKDVQEPSHRLTSCGMTCVYMALQYLGSETPTLDEMIQGGVEAGGYGRSGWIHDYFVNLFQESGYECERHEHMRDSDVHMISFAIKNGSPVILSVERRLWDQRLFHMVLITGVRESSNGDLEGFFYHDPASLRENGSRHLYVPLGTFYLDWRRMAIFPKKK